jgi:hypothetical protein
MANPNPSYQSKRVKKRPQSGITSDRYEFLGLDQAEPDLGDPLVGVSSVGANPFPIGAGDPYILVSDASGSGKRYWTQKANIIAGGVVQPGAISVYQNGNLAPNTNELSIFKLNFTGAGVTVIGVGSDRADVDITVTDVSLVSGQTGSVAYKDSNGLIQGSNTFIFNSSNNNVGVGSTQPKQRLDVLGNANISNNLVVGSAITANSIKTNAFEVDRFTINDTTIVFKITEDAVGIGTTLPIATLDVRGTTNISGVATVNSLVSRTSISSQTLNIGTTQVISSSRQLQNIASLDAVTTATIETAIANAPNTFNDLNVTGIATFQQNIGVSGLTTSRDLRVTGITTLETLGVTGLTTSRNLTVTGITTLGTLGVTGLTTARDLQVSGISTLSSLGVTGLTTSRNLTVTGITTVNNFFISSGSTVSIASSVGIGTTVARYNLDVNGNINLTGTLNLNGNAGTDGQVLLSKGSSSSPVWGSASGVNVGSATSVTTIDRVNTNQTYYLSFVERTTGSLNQSILLDSDNLAYNPSTNSLGIGTTSPTANLNVSGSTLLNGRSIFSGITTIRDTLDINASGIRYVPTTGRLGIGTTNPGSTLAIGGTITEEFAGQYWNVVTQADVGYGASQVPLNQYLGQLAFLDEYLPPQFRNTEVVTTSTSAVTLDSLDCGFERSARYNIQITCNGQLIGSGTSSSSRSISNLSQGQDYVSGSYTNIELLTTSGSGNDARANLTVEPETSLTLTAIQDGNFAFQNDVSSLNVNKPILFNQAIPPTAAENSRLTSINITNTGFGYTNFPTVNISAPTNNPPISGVSGIGSTATAQVATMCITDFRITQAGIHTEIPTVTFNAPIGVGTTATGRIGFGISTIVVTNSGFNYSFIPTVSVPGNNVGTAATARVNRLFATNIRIDGTGFGYAGTSGPNYPTITIQSPTGVGTTATAVVNTLSISTHFSIPNPGAGYTRPPILTVGSPAGIGTTATIGCNLGIVTFTNILPGSGYTIAPTLTVSPSPTNFVGRVGMGVSGTGILISGGGGYDSNPSVSFSPVGGIGTGAQGTAQINVSGQVESISITNPGFGYTVPPIIVFTGGTPETVAVATITQMFLTDIQVLNVGFGVTTVSSVFLSPSGGLGNGASASAVMGIGTVFVNEFGSGYTSNPSISVTAVDGITGAGGMVNSLGLGVTSSNITITNPGAGYTFIPSVTFSSPTGIGTSTRGSVGVGISEILVTNPGAGYSVSIPSVSFSGGVPGDTGSGVGAAVSTIIVTNVVITNSGAGYTQFDLAQSGIATFSPSGTTGIVGFGVSTITVTSTGIGYTTAQSAVVTITAPVSGIGSTARASASLGFPGILPGPGYGVTTQIYYIAEIPTASTLKLSTRPGIGTLTSSNVANVSFASSNPIVLAGGKITNVSVVSPGSGYTSGSIISVNNTFDNGNVGSGFSFNPITVNNFQVSDVMLLQSVGSGNTAADYMEYSTVANEEILGTFSANIVEGSNPQYSANLQFTPTYRNNTIKISRDRFTV